MVINIKNKVIVITGASRGIGFELAKHFAIEGARVVLNYNKSEEQVKKGMKEIRQKGENCIAIKADVSNPFEVEKMYTYVLHTYGHIDVLINNAGVCDDATLQYMTYEKWRNILDVNLTGVFLCSKVFAQVMIANKKGKIINIASLKGQEGSVGQINYSASKGGVIAATKTMAKELGQYNISVNAICPGFIVTDLNRCNPEKAEIAKRKSVLNCQYAMTDLIAFLELLISEQCNGVSGQIFNLDSRIL